MPDRLVIGIDLGGTKLLAGAVGEDLEVHHRAWRAAPTEGPGAVLDAIADVVGELREASGGQVAGVGLGVPCVLDHARGVAVMSVHLPIEELALREVVSERLGLPVWLDNDANLALLAEWRAGAAQGASDALMLTIGTGIGGGIVADGRLLRGAVGAGAELGHMVVDLDGPPCFGACPNHGCLEALASGSALAREARRVASGSPDSGLGRVAASGRPITGALVTELAHDGDPSARDVVTLIGTRLGVGLAGLANAFNPAVIVIGGGVIAAGELLLAPARDELKRRALRPNREARVVAAGFGAESGMLGAARLALEGLAAPRAAA